MADKKLYMIGVIHGDDRAKKRLLRILQNISPDVVTVEFTNYGLNFRTKNVNWIKKKVKKIFSCMNDEKEKIKNSLKILKIPYEYLTAKRYAEAKRIPLFLVDMDFFSFFRLRYVRELLDGENLLKLVNEEHCPPLQIEKRIANAYFEKNIKIFSSSEEMRVRDEYTVRLITKIMEENIGRVIAHICGWQHLIDENGYYSKFNPQKIYIYDKSLGF